MAGVHGVLPIDGIPGLYQDLVSGAADERRRDVRMPAVVAPIRLVPQGPAPIKTNFVTHDH
jgi:hypothetical protein